MSLARTFKGAATAVLSTMVVATAIAGPMSGTALAAKPLPTPTPQITSGPAQPVSTSKSANFVWAAAASTTTYTCSLDGGKPSSCISPKAYSNLSDAAHTLVLKATQQGTGGTRYKAASVSYGWTVDTTPPAVPTVQQLLTTSSTSATINFTSDATAKSFTCQVDQVDSNGAVITNIVPSTPGCTSGWPVTLPSGVNANYRASVWATDLYGNTTATPGTMTWTVDSQAPVTPTVTIAQAPLTNQTYMDATLSTDDASATFSCSIDGAPAQACGTGIPTTAHFNGPFGQGTHPLTVVATDHVGNVSVPKTAMWTVDTTAPAVSVVSGPATTTNQQSATFNVSVDDPNATLLCKMDSGAFTACPSGFNYAGPIDAGSHTFAVQATDAAGNVAVSNTYGWTINLAAPAPAYFLDGPADPSNSSSATFDWDATDPANTTAYACTLDGNPWGNTTSCDSSTAPVTVTGLSDGPHIFGVTALNGTAASAEVRYSWTVDTQAPGAPVFSTTPATNSTTAVFSFASNGASQFDCELDAASPNSSAIDSAAKLCASPVTYYNLSQGSHTFDVWATDSAGNTSHGFFQWTIDTSAPTAPTLTGPTGVVADTATHLGWSDADASVTSSSCSIDSGTVSNPCPSDQAQPTLADGQHAFTVTVGNGNGALSSQTIQWVLDTTPPAVQFNNMPATVVSSPDAAPSVSVVDANPGTTSCTLSDGTNVVSTTCGPYFNLADGTYSITATATDLAGHVTQATSPSWTVDTTPPATPTVDGPASTTSTKPSFTFADSEAGVSFGCSIDGAAFSDCSSPYGVPTALSVGAHSLVVQASDSVGNAASSTPFAFQVTALPAPSVTGPNGITSNPVATIGVSDSSPEETSIVCYVDGVSQGVCAPSYTLGDGPHSLVAYAVNANGDKSDGSPALNWTVDSTAPVVTINNAPSGTITNPDVSFTVTQSDANPSGTINCSLTGPVSSTSCGSFNALPDGAYSFTATTTDAAGNVGTASANWTVKALVTDPSGGPTDTTAPTVTSVTATKTLTGASSAAFSETVHGLVAGGAALVVTGTSTVAPTTVKCLSGSTAVACSSSFTSLQLVPTKALTAGQHYTVRLNAGAVQDAAGNALVAKSVNFRASQSEQENSAGATAAWTKVSSKSAYGRSFVRANLSGSSASYTFTGSTLTWWTTTGKDQGKATVYIDGKKKATVNNYAAATHFKVARKYTKLGNKRHTVKIVVSGVKGAKSGTGTFITVDAFTVGTKRSNTPSLAMTLHSATSSHFSGRHATSDKLKGETISFTFRGTGIAFYTMKSRNQGKVAAYVDGVRKATFDNYSAKTGYGVKRSITKLSDKVHTLKLVVLGTHHKGGTGTWVTVDRFLVS